MRYTLTGIQKKIAVMKRRFVRSAAAAAIAGIILAACAGTAYASQGYWDNYLGDWYFIHYDGTFATGWLEDAGSWYYLYTVPYIIIGSRIGRLTSSLINIII